MAVTGLVTGIISLVPAVIIMITGSSIMAFGDSDKKSIADNSTFSHYAEDTETTSKRDNIVDSKHSYDYSQSDTIPDKNQSTESNSKVTKDNDQTAEDNIKTENATLSVSEIKDLIENGDFSLVTPEFKETMDSYEAFCDDYVKFMQDYSSGEMNVMDMLDDYTKMLSDMVEWTTKIEEMDTENLSPADSAYYTLVTLRVSKKLLDVVL